MLFLQNDGKVVPDIEKHRIFNIFEENVKQIQQRKTN